MDKVAPAVAYSANGALVLFGFTLNDIGAAVGILLGLGTFVLHWLYQRKRTRIVQEELKAIREAACQSKQG